LIKPATTLIDRRLQVGDAGHRSLHLPPFRFYADISLIREGLYGCRTSSKAIERDFPHIVEIVVPPGGLDTRLDAMYDWHRGRGVEAHHGSGRREEDRDIILFADRELAGDFAAAFGGETSRRLFLRSRAHTAPRIDLLFGVRHLSNRGLVGLIDIFLRGPLFLRLSFVFFARPRRCRRMLRMSVWHLHQQHCRDHCYRRAQGYLFFTSRWMMGGGVRGACMGYLPPGSQK
jgi:hypothetical protein